MNELWRLSASEVARRVRTREVSAREVADAALQRLDSVNPRINAIVDCRPDLVREQADRVDSVLARGNDPGPLAGVPVTVKINIDQAGFATTDGSRLYENRIAKFNSPAVDNVVRAGAVLLGRSNAPTFAIRWFTSNLLYGGTHTHNPRDPLLTPGGSSGGGELLASQRASDTLPWGRTSVAQCAIPRMLAVFMGYVPASGEFLTIGAPTTCLRPSPTSALS